MLLLLLLFVVVVVVVVVIIVVIFLFSFSIVLCRHFTIIRLFIALGLLHFRFAGVWIQRLRRYAFNSKRLFFSRFYLFPQRIFSGRGDGFDRHHARTSRWNRGGNVLRPRGKFCGEDNGTYVFASRWKRRRLSIFHLRLIRRRSEDFSSTFFFFFFFFYFYF